MREILGQIHRLRSVMMLWLACAGLFTINTSATAAVLPPTANVMGYSLEDMASAVANFSISVNDVTYYPTTPFQILYRLGNLQDPTGANTFRVAPGTFLYVKFFFIDDSAPIIGNW